MNIKKLFRSKVVIAVSVLIMTTLVVTLLIYRNIEYEATHGKTRLKDTFNSIVLEVLQVPTKVVEVPVPVEPEPEIQDPLVTIIAKYQKLRHSRIPIELAAIQAQLIVDVAKEKDIPVALLVGIAETESKFDPLAESKVGASGLTQVLIEDGVIIDHAKKFDIRYNLETGTKILQSKLAKFNDNLPQALKAYSGGDKEYADRVYASVGRFTVFRERQLKESNLVSSL